MRNLVTAEIAELLITLAQDSEAWAQDCNATSEEAEQARAVAAEIQETLAEDERLRILSKSWTWMYYPWREGAR